MFRPAATAATDNLAAAALAADKMEELKNTAYASLADGTDTQESIFTRTWTVTANSPATGMSTLVVTVAWNWQGTTSG